MTIKVHVLTLGIAATNCYIVGDEDTGAALLIDPVDAAERLYAKAGELGWNIELILATHAHFDHILASKELKELTGAPFKLHKDGLPFMQNLPQQGLRFTGQPFPQAADPDGFLTTEPEVVELGPLKLETLYTPGHCPGHISFFMREENILFSGDTLFAGSIGRTDLPGADYELLMRSIFDQLLPLGDDVTVLPGHMGPTTIGQERQSNPWLLQYANEQG